MAATFFVPCKIAYSANVPSLIRSEAPGVLLIFTEIYLFEEGTTRTATGNNLDSGSKQLGQQQRQLESLSLLTIIIIIIITIIIIICMTYYILHSGI